MGRASCFFGPGSGFVGIFPKDRGTGPKGMSTTGESPGRQTVMSCFAPRQAQTTIPCPHCKKPLAIERSCRSARMRCPSCQKTYPLRDYIARADKAMEDFLDNCYVDRI